MVRNQRETNQIEILTITLSHILALDTLPPHHKGPFDRMLIAQAQAESAVVLSQDPIIAKYPVPVV
jgi:PIN domain nuclease of toxin-antitoxin system